MSSSPLPFTSALALLLAVLALTCFHTTSAGTWLSFNQKTGGLDIDAPVPQRSVASIKNIDGNDIMRLIKVCNDQLSKRVIQPEVQFTRQQRRDAEMCRSVLELVSRR